MKSLTFLCLFMSSLILVGCGNKTTTPPTTPETSVNTPSASGQGYTGDVTPIQTGVTEVTLAPPSVGEGKMYDASGKPLPALSPEREAEIRKELMQ